MELIIDRSKWLRGEGFYESYLLRPRDGKMCCLGFYSLACGLKEEQIRNVKSPRSLVSGDPSGANLLNDTCGSWLIYEDNVRTVYHSLDTAELMDHNDTRGESDSEREKWITKIFAKHGVTVRFVDST
jgi:hypothetical protein